MTGKSGFIRVIAGIARCPGGRGLGSFVRIGPDQGAGSGAVHRKAEEGAMAEPWQPTTTPRGAVPDPASPARSERGAPGSPRLATGERTARGTPAHIPMAPGPARGRRRARRARGARGGHRRDGGPRERRHRRPRPGPADGPDADLGEQRPRPRRAERQHRRRRLPRHQQRPRLPPEVERQPRHGRLLHPRQRRHRQVRNRRAAAHPAALRRPRRRALVLPARGRRLRRLHGPQRPGRHVPGRLVQRAVQRRLDRHLRLQRQPGPAVAAARGRPAGRRRGGRRPRGGPLCEGHLQLLLAHPRPGPGRAAAAAVRLARLVQRHHGGGAVDVLHEAHHRLGVRAGLHPRFRPRHRRRVPGHREDQHADQRQGHPEPDRRTGQQPHHQRAAGAVRLGRAVGAGDEGHRHLDLRRERLPLDRRRHPDRPAAQRRPGRCQHLPGPHQRHLLRLRRRFLTVPRRTPLR
ncbi:putative Uncharacterized 50.6 kDa protein in the 5'region of gyrA and gyrB [Streptomyces misionensis JCM 4497]